MARLPPTPEDVRRGERLRVLRERFGFSQGEVLPGKHTQIINAEKGRNKLQGRLSQSYARAFGLDLDQFMLYAEGKLSLDDAMRLSTKEPKKKAQEKSRESLERAVGQLPLELLQESAAEIVVRAGFPLRRSERAVRAVAGFYEPSTLVGAPEPAERLARVAIRLLEADGEEIGEPPGPALRLSDPPGPRKRRGRS